MSLRAAPPRRPSIPTKLPYSALLYSLRGQASPQSEALLLVAARDWDPTIRTAAVSSLGWWEPLNRPDVVGVLQWAREDANADVRRQAEAALARLGERRALQLMRAALVGESEGGVPEAIRFIAAERLFWLWPELDTLADADDLETALAAREALEQMREDIAGGLLLR
jgi:HEAT repeat protein